MGRLAMRMSRARADGEDGDSSEEDDFFYNKEESTETPKLGPAPHYLPQRPKIDDHAKQATAHFKTVKRWGPELRKQRSSQRLRRANTSFSLRSINSARSVDDDSL